MIGPGAWLAADAAVADPTMWSRIIHAWPSLALIGLTGAYRLLMREFHTAAKSVHTASAAEEQDAEGGPKHSSRASLRLVASSGQQKVPKVHSPFQARAWAWAEEWEQEHGALPDGKKIGERSGRKERWGRLVKERGLYERGSSSRRTVKEVTETGATCASATPKWPCCSEKGDKLRLISAAGKGR